MLSDEQQQNFSDFMAVLDSVEHSPSEVLRYCLDQWLALCYLTRDRLVYIRGCVDTEFARIEEATTATLRGQLAKVLPAFDHKPHTPLLIFPDEYSGLVSDNADSCAVLGLIAIANRHINLALALIDLFHALQAEGIAIRASWRGAA